MDEDDSADTPEEDNPDPDPDTRCGFGTWTPDCLQKAASPKLFLLFFTLAATLEGAQLAYFTACISTLEKRFSYDTKMTGLVMLGSEMGPICFGALVGYFGGKTHRPRFMGFGMFLVFLSNLVMSTPYFVYGYGHLEGRNRSRFFGIEYQFCDKAFNEHNDSCLSSVATPVLSILAFAIVLRGIGINVLYTVGTPYLDDSVKKIDSSVYFGVLSALNQIGPILGYLLSSLCLQFYEDPLYDPGFGPEDPRWIGAWWMGFLILGAGVLLFAMPIVLFPKSFDGRKLPSSVETTEPTSRMQQIKDIGKALKRLAKNPLLVCYYLGAIFRGNGTIGYGVLLSKYMEMQFRKSASKASLLSGPAVVIGQQLGVLLGGLLIRKFRPRPRVMTGSILVADLFNVIALISCMLLTCPLYHVTGITPSPGGGYTLENQCNKDCVCDTESYTPVCGPDGESTYFSPCYAGCTSYNDTGGEEVFIDCKCVYDAAGNITTGNATSNYCDSGCQAVIAFIAFLTIGKLLSSTSDVPVRLLSLRSVDPGDKSLSIGVFSAAYSLLSYIPTPLVFGALTDSSCLVWEESCGQRGSCWIYDADKLRFLLHGVSAMFILLGVVADIFVVILSPRLEDLYEEEGEEKNLMTN